MKEPPAAEPPPDEDQTARGWKVGMSCKAKWQDGRGEWYAGRIDRVNDDGTFGLSRFR